MNEALKTWNRTKFIKGDLSIQCRSSILQYQASSKFSQHRRIQSSKNKHECHESTVSKSTQPVSVSIWYWHQDLMAKRIIMGVWKAKWKKVSHICKWSLDKRKSYYRSYARSSDCHATDAHRAICIWKLCNGTSEGASNLVAYEDLEHFWGGSSLDYTTQVL